jgi:hypothetical protein
VPQRQRVARINGVRIRSASVAGDELAVADAGLSEAIARNALHGAQHAAANMNDGALARASTSAQQMRP